MLSHSLMKMLWLTALACMPISAHAQMSGAPKEAQKDKSTPPAFVWKKLGDAEKKEEPSSVEHVAPSNTMNQILLNRPTDNTGITPNAAPLPQPTSPAAAPVPSYSPATAPQGYKPPPPSQPQEKRPQMPDPAAVSSY